MPDDKSISLLNLASLSKPADTLIKKVSAAIGCLYEPWHITRVAKADAKAALIKAKSEIEVTDLHRRTIHRFVEEEAQKQINMELIIEKALPHLNTNSDPNEMENDWITNFFDKSRIVSDQEMQELWAIILAGEANSPGTFSKRTVNFMVDLDKRDAEFFQNLCRFGWVIDTSYQPLIFNPNHDIYNKNGINFLILAHLDSIGLIQLRDITGYAKNQLPKHVSLNYHNHTLVLEMPLVNGNSLSIGKAILTQIGRELAIICINNLTEIEGFFDYVKEQWKQYLPSGT